jgi:hypothetical protein
MIVAREVIAAREARLGGHCREGYRLATSDPEYRAHVLARLRPELARPPGDLWAAIPWIWALSLGGDSPASGAMATAVKAAAGVLGDWLRDDTPYEALEPRWNATAACHLGLGSTLRSHPFADVRAWSIRPRSAASSSMPRGS